MPDVLRLSVVYETARATSVLNTLSGAQTKVHTGARQIESAMRAIATSSLGISGPLARVAEGLLRFGTGGVVTLGVVAGIGLIAGAYKLASDEADALSKTNDKLADSFAGQFGGQRAKLIKDLADANEQLRKLKATSDALAPSGNFGFAATWQRAKAMFLGPGIDVEQINAQKAIATATNLILGLNTEINSSIQDQITAREKLLQQQREAEQLHRNELFLLTSEQNYLEARVLLGMSAAGHAAVAPFDTMRFGQPATAARPLDTRFGQRPDQPLSGGLDHRFGQGVGLGFTPATDRLTAQQQRIVDSWTAGLDVMQQSLEDFLVTGKFVFRQFADDVLRIAFKAATDQLFDRANIVKTIYDVATHSTQYRKAIGKT